MPCGLPRISPLFVPTVSRLFSCSLTHCMLFSFYPETCPHTLPQPGRLFLPFLTHLTPPQSSFTSQIKCHVFQAVFPPTTCQLGPCLNNLTSLLLTHVYQLIAIFCFLVLCLIPLLDLGPAPGCRNCGRSAHPGKPSVQYSARM